MTETIAEIHIGDAVTFADPHGVRHPALVTAVWGFNTREAQLEFYRHAHTTDVEAGKEWATDERWQLLAAMPWTIPSVNVVYVEEDEAKRDPYGRQIARNTSIVHRSSQAAHGMYWE